MPARPVHQPVTDGKLRRRHPGQLQCPTCRGHPPAVSSLQGLLGPKSLYPHRHPNRSTCRHCWLGSFLQLLLQVCFVLLGCCEECLLLLLLLLQQQQTLCGESSS